MGWAKHYATGAGFRWWPCEELVRFVGDRHFGSVLEAGCGNGANLWYLADHATKTVGVDSCRAALDAAELYVVRPQRLVPHDIEVHQADIRQLPFQAATFDVLVDCMASQHLPWAEHEALYREYRRVLKPGGLLWLYHLDCQTVAQRGEWRGNSDWAGVALFPEADFFCLPIQTQLSDVVEAAGFLTPIVRGLAREYPDGQVAHYSIIEAETA